jgi:hypothetical protein
VRVSDTLSPVRQHLRDSIKAKLPVKPTDASAQHESKSVDAPLVLPPFLVNESRDVHVFAKVTGALAQENYLSARPLFKTEATARLRFELLHRPMMDDQPSPSGMPRTKLDIFQLKW